MPLEDTNNCSDYPLGECCVDISTLQNAIKHKTIQDNAIISIDSTWSKKNNLCIATCNSTNQCFWVKNKITTTLQIK